MDNLKQALQGVPNILRAIVADVNLLRERIDNRPTLADLSQAKIDLSVRMDEFEERLTRIERRLDA